MSSNFQLLTISSRAILRRFPLISCGFCAIGPLIAPTTDSQAVALLGALFWGAAWIGMRHLRFIRLGPVIHLFLWGPFRQVIDLQVRLGELERLLANARNMEHCWEAIQADCGHFGFCGGRLRVEGRVFETAARPASTGQHWQLRVPLAEGQYLNLYHDAAALDHPAVIARLAIILRNALQARIAAREGRTSQVVLRLPSPAAAHTRTLTATAR